MYRPMRRSLLHWASILPDPGSKNADICQISEAVYYSTTKSVLYLPLLEETVVQGSIEDW